MFIHPETNCVQVVVASSTGLDNFSKKNNNNKKILTLVGKILFLSKFRFDKK